MPTGATLPTWAGGATTTLFAGLIYLGVVTGDLTDSDGFALLAALASVSIAMLVRRARLTLALAQHPPAELQFRDYTAITVYPGNLDVMRVDQVRLSNPLSQVFRWTFFDTRENLYARKVDTRQAYKMLLSSGVLGTIQSAYRLTPNAMISSYRLDTADGDQIAWVVLYPGDMSNQAISNRSG